MYRKGGGTQTFFFFFSRIMPDGLEQPMGTAQSTSVQRTTNEQVLPFHQPEQLGWRRWGEGTVKGPQEHGREVRLMV